jgi:hypothetical protein
LFFPASQGLPWKQADNNQIMLSKLTSLFVAGTKGFELRRIGEFCAPHLRKHSLAESDKAARIFHEHPHSQRFIQE